MEGHEVASDARAHCHYRGSDIWYAQEVPIGVLSAQSGSTAFSGVPMANGTHLAVDEANQKNYLGTAKVKLIDGNYASDKAQAISLANQRGPKLPAR